MTLIPGRWQMKLAHFFVDIIPVQGSRTLCRGPRLEDKTLDGDTAAKCWAIPHMAQIIRLGDLRIKVVALENGVPGNWRKHWTGRFSRWH